MSNCGCCSDIHTAHAELIHAATDIQFQISYTNGILPASITDIDKKNVQQALEKYLSLAGIPIKHEEPVGLKNRVNLIYRTANEFVTGSLEVYLSHIQLFGDQTSLDRDYDIHIDNKGFTLRLNINKPHALNCPPRQYEPLFVNYNKRITFNTKGGT